MDLVYMVIVLVLLSGFLLWAGYQIGRYSAKIPLLEKIEDLEGDIFAMEDEFQRLKNPTPVVPQKHRIRTAEADPTRNARVVSARLRAKKSYTPDPRK